jgi:hypothetical protein
MKFNLDPDTSKGERRVSFAEDPTQQMTVAKTVLKKEAIWLIQDMIYFL